MWDPPHIPRTHTMSPPPRAAIFAFRMEKLARATASSTIRDGSRAPPAACSAMARPRPQLDRTARFCPKTSRKTRAHGPLSRRLQTPASTHGRRASRCALPACTCAMAEHLRGSASWIFDEQCSRAVGIRTSAAARARARGSQRTRSAQRRPARTAGLAGVGRQGRERQPGRVLAARAGSE